MEDSFSDDDDEGDSDYEDHAGEYALYDSPLEKVDELVYLKETLEGIHNSNSNTYQFLVSTQTQEEASGPNDTEILESLDGYGHMTYTFGFGEEGDERGDWLACLDFKVFTDCDGVICVGYHAVVNSESGSFIETALEAIEENLESARGLPEYILGLGFSSGVWTEKEVQDALDCAKRWREDLAKAFEAEEATHG